MNIPSPKLLIFSLLAIPLLSVAWQPVEATVISFKDASNVDWEISYPDQFILQFDITVPAAANRNTIGKLTDKTERRDFSPEVITFTQKGAAKQNDSVTNGLRLLFETNTINATETPWVGFKTTLVDLDLSRFAALADKDHPPEAHFHTKNGASYAPFTGFAAPGSSSGCAPKVAPDVACNMFVTDGVNRVDPLGIFSIRNLLLHERVFSADDFAAAGIIGDSRRNFQLILQPIRVPEPNTLLLAGLGLLVVRVAQRSRRK